MRKKSPNRIIIIIAIGFSLVVLGRLGALRPVTRVLGAATSPIMRWVQTGGTTTGGFFGFLGQIKNLSQRNADLEQQVGDLKQQLAADAEMRVEDAALRQQLGFSATNATRTVPASIIAYQPDNFRAFLTINRGKHDGLAADMAVTSQGNLVGKLINVQDATSQVFLLTDPDFRVAVLDQTSRASGTVHGQIGGGLTLDNVPQDQTIKTGDMLVTSGLGGDFPKGLVVGQIEIINHQDNAIFQSAQVVSGSKINQLEVVFVVTGP